MLQDNLPENKIDDKRILVTGATGLVGNQLLQQLLESGYRVKAIFHSAPIIISHPSLEIVQCDILDVFALEEVMKDITHVYHCAALVSYDPKDIHQIFKINVEGTANVVNACIDAGVHKMVHVSSVAALGRIRKGETVTEKMSWTEETSNSVYGKSKYLGELEVWRGIGEGLPAVIVNPSLVLGGDNWESSSSAIFKNAYNEFKWYTEGVSGFVDIRDVARVMILLMNSEISAERFIINADNLPYKEIFSLIATCFGKRIPYKKVTPFLAEMIWRVEAVKSKFTGKKHLLTKETTRTAQAKIYYDNSKILNVLPHFKFTKIKNSIEYTCTNLKEKYQL
ncbi:MAG: NAD-dependent epimerase/dehydratase family protein [Bacteroidota bacterium]|jgi:dihydroflavonol-4-reductase|nr:NAD-dependent epimerase/dehydratase family protein [Bacteroidota bacterium]